MPRPVLPAFVTVAMFIAGGLAPLCASPAGAASYELCLHAPEDPHFWWREGLLDVGRESFDFEAYLGAPQCFRASGTGRVFAEANLGDRTLCDGPPIPPTRTRRVDVAFIRVPTPLYARPVLRCQVSWADPPPSAGPGDAQDKNARLAAGGHQRVAGHVAERTKVLRRRHVGGTNLQNLAGRHVPQQPARFQDRQRTFQSGRVQEAVRAIRQPVRARQQPAPSSVAGTDPRSAVSGGTVYTPIGNAATPDDWAWTIR